MILLSSNVFDTSGSAKANRSIQSELGRCIIAADRYLHAHHSAAFFLYGATKRSWYPRLVCLQLLQHTPRCQYAICWNDEPSIEAGNATAAQPTPLWQLSAGASRLRTLAFGVHSLPSAADLLHGGRWRAWCFCTPPSIYRSADLLLLFKLDASWTMAGSTGESLFLLPLCLPLYIFFPGLYEYLFPAALTPLFLSFVVVFL